MLKRQIEYSATQVVDAHRQILVAATATNARGHTSERYVDQQTFTLWQLLLETRHNQTVSVPRPCVWLPEQECERSDYVLEHTAFRRDVSRLSFECYNQETGITETRVRFAPSDELEVTTRRLLNHFSGRHTYVALNTQAGQAVAS